MMNELDKYLSYLVEWIDYKKDELIFEEDFYKKLLSANSKWNILNEYIYNNFFYELLEYQEIANLSLKKYIESSYKTTSFYDSNFINRWDFFLTETWIKTTEINSDTPGWYLETVLLNELIADQTLNPNKDFLNNFLKWINEILGDCDKWIFILWSLSYREDYKLMQFVSDFLIENWIKSYIWLQEELNLDNDKVYYRWQEIGILFRYYPIDWVYETFDMSNIERLQDKNLFKILNHQCSYIFQLKSYFSFLWENIEKFEDYIQKIIFEIIPLSIRMDKILDTDLSNILENKDNWVLKDINNREWKWIYIWKNIDENLWKTLITRYFWNKNYILQESLNIIKTDWFEINLWVYNIKNNFSWIYIRAWKSKTNINSFSLPVSIKKSL